MLEPSLQKALPVAAPWWHTVSTLSLHAVIYFILMQHYFTIHIFTRSQKSESEIKSERMY